MLSKAKAPTALTRGRGGYDEVACTDQDRSPLPNCKTRSSKLDQHEFQWRGFALQVGHGGKPILKLVADPTHPHLYRIKYPDGWRSTPANLTRAKDAAYGHARYLLGRLRPVEAPYSPEDQVAA